jgi:hypothetical protein
MLGITWRERKSEVQETREVVVVRIVRMIVGMIVGMAVKWMRMTGGAALSLHPRVLASSPSSSPGALSH